MDAYEARLVSFAPKKSSKSRKQQAVSGGWPHPPSFHATPARLAQAGFYFKPSPSKPDNVLCFMCGNALGNWEEQDDPFKVHVEHSPKCAWAIARCSIEDDKRGDKFVFTSTTRLPTSRILEKARAETFKGAWPHDNIKGHSANSKKMAKAGWVFTPESQEDSDTATCFYCGKSLAGWEPEDNPTEEHKTRMPNCPFFTGKVTSEDDQEDENLVVDLGQSKPPQSKASTSHSRPGRTHTRTASKSRRTAAMASASEAEPGGDGEDDTDAPAPLKKKLPRAASVKSVPPTPVDPPRGVSRSVSSKRLKAQDEDVEMAVDTAEEPPQPIVSKSSKTKKGKAKILQATEPNDLDVQEVEHISAKSFKKAKGKQRAIEEVQIIDLDDDEVVEAPPPENLATNSKVKPPSIKAPSIKAPPHPIARTPPPEPSKTVPVVVPKLALQPVSRPPKPSRDDDMDLKEAEEELENMAMELDPTGEVRSQLKTSSSRPASSRGGAKSQEASSKSSSQHPGHEFALQVASLAWPTTGRKPMSRSGSVRAMMAEDEMEEEEVVRSLNEMEEEGEVDIQTIAKLRPQSRNAERPPSTAPWPQTNGRSKTLAEHPTSSRASNKGKAKAVDPLHSEVAPPKPRTPSPAPVTNIFPSLGGVVPLSSSLLPDEVHIQHLTEEDKDMTLEAYIRREIERREEELRADGQKWIEEFLAYAEQARETIRTM